MLNRRTTIIGSALNAINFFALPTHANLTNRSRPLYLSTLSEMIKNREITAVNLAESFIQNHDELKKLGVFTSINEDHLFNRAAISDKLLLEGKYLGALHGIPIALKDNIDVVGHITTGGTPALRSNYPKVNAPIVQRLLYAGANIAGKVNMHELAGGGTSNNPSYLHTKNPYNLKHIPGGSSGGSAAAVSARIVAAAIGTDTAGSVRNPSSYCGVVGFRPTTNRYPNTGIFPLSLARDTAGPIALNVGDCVTLDQIMALDATPVQSQSLKGLRIGIPKTPFLHNLNTDVETSFENTKQILRRMGMQLIEKDMPGLETLIDEANLISMAVGLKRDINQYLLNTNSNISFNDIVAKIADPFVLRWMTDFINPSESLLAREEFVRTITLKKLQNIFYNYITQNKLKAIMFPTTPVPAGIQVPGSDDLIIEGKRIKDAIWLNIQNTAPGSLWGGPGISMPMGMTATGLPIGLALDGLPDKDTELLSLALSIEKELPLIPPPRHSVS